MLTAALVAAGWLALAAFLVVPIARRLRAVQVEDAPPQRCKGGARPYRPELVSVDTLAALRAAECESDWITAWQEHPPLSAADTVRLMVLDEQRRRVLGARITREAA